MTAPTGGGAAPRTDCIADAAGGVTFDIAGTGAPDASLVLRRRGGTADTVRLPLTPAGGSHSRTVLPGTAELAEGTGTRTRTTDRPSRPASAICGHWPAGSRRLA
ncbi:hypothetical protein QMZ92_02140 [Streptomyces sp. HNM0645]|uniref:hypothetical protein n=1 Tax=Streptomyces sp. HNM0645 TaxID=2782343 RepID=UPI0024B68624|nr:hypothetical protein [Streptomyces sp. HNM0645]MDI9883231.1 hypothetical protein [Streptomyces sp. HNM0645]